MSTEKMNTGLDINQIKEYLPHRYPMLLVDRVLKWESGKCITAIKNVTANEEFFNGHFPNKPVMPGVLMIEALAQTAALLSFLTVDLRPDDNTVVYFLGIDNARFKRPVGPGDQLVLEAEIVKVARGIWKYKARALVDGQLAVEADMMCTIRTVDNQQVAASMDVAIGRDE
jgi:3-hydroxyacyl-[acyl-carrier-protein] dehydratase